MQATNSVSVLGSRTSGHSWCRSDAPRSAKRLTWSAVASSSPSGTSSQPPNVFSDQSLHNRKCSHLQCPHLQYTHHQCPHLQYTHQSAVFGLSLSLPPLVGGGGGLVCESVGNADLLSDHFDGKQSRESVDLPLICHPSPSLTSFAFRSSEVVSAT